MRKIGILICLPLIIALCGCSGNRTSDWEKLHLKGKIKQLYEQQFLAVDRFGKPEKGDLYRESGWDFIYEFDEKGNYSKQTFLNTLSDEVGHSTFTYNKKGLLSEEIAYDAEGGYSDKTTYLYDEKDRVNQVIFFNNTDNIVNSLVMEYNDETNKVTTCKYTGRGKLITKQIQTLDKKGAPTETFIFNDKDEIVNHRKEIYSKDGLLKNITAYTPDGKIYMIVKFEHDNKGNVLSEQGLDENGEAFVPVRYEYSFDKEGNWIRKIRYEGDKAVTITDRSIEYY